MRFGSKVTYCLLATVVLVAIFFRYPLGIEHEMGSDTTFIHSLANSLAVNAYAPWILHPLSYFGLYALSYPSAMPFLFASLSLTGGIPIEASILVMGFVFAVIGALGAFAASRAAKDDDRLAMAVALLFSIAPFYTKDTTWVGSSRGFVTALVPIVFFLLLRHLRTRDVRYLALCFVVVLMMGAIHRMGFLALIVLVAYAFAAPFHRITQKLRFVLLRYESPFRLVSVAASISGFFALFYLQVLFPGAGGADLVSQYGTGALFQGTSFIVLVANMMVSLAGKVGILTPLVVFGLVRLTWDRPKEAKDKFLLVTVLVMIPLLSLRDYISEFLTYVFVLLLVLALLGRWRIVLRKRAAATVVVGLLLGSSVAFSWVMKDYWRDRYYTDQPIPSQLYTTSVFLLRESDGTILSNEGLSQGRITAITGRAALPVGGASIHWFSPQQLTFGFVDGSRLSVRGVPITSISFDTDSIFVPLGIPNAKDDYEAIFYGHLSDASTVRLVQLYGVQYLFIDKPHPTQFQSYIWRDSAFLKDARQELYKVYDSTSYSVWFV